MAIYHFHFSSVQRSKGMCSIPYAAYVRGTAMTDERTGTNYSFASKEDVAYSNILIPANSPAWLKGLVELNMPEGLTDLQKLTLAKDNQNLASEKLWNMSELRSLKCNARTANIIDLALPKELSLEENIELLEEFAQETYVDKGMIADIAIHLDEENKNPHGHLILTNREVTENGFGMVNEYWNTNAFLHIQRKDWADKVNQHLELKGIDARVDHRSYVEQGIDLVPTVHLGVGKYHEGKDRFYQNQEIKQINALRILENPGIAFDALAKYKAVFTRDDLADIALRYSDNDQQFNELLSAMSESKDLLEVGKSNGKTTYTARSMLLMNEDMVEPSIASTRDAIINEQALARFKVLSGENVEKEALDRLDALAKTTISSIEAHNGLFNDWDIGRVLGKYNLCQQDYLAVAAKIKGSEEVIYMGSWIDGQDTYTTKEKFAIDCDIQDLTDRLYVRKHLKIADTVRTKLLQEYQDSLPANKKLNEKQYIAVEHVLGGDCSINCIVGRAGTGKSYSLKAAQHVFEELGVNVYGVALQGVAADKLSQDGINARTVESFKYALRHKSIQLKRGDALFVDEAGMMDSESKRFVLQVANDYKLKIILVGDPNQIDPVGSGAPFKWILSRIGFKEITTVVRQKIEWQAKATEELSVFKLREGLGAYDQHGCIQYGKSRSDTMVDLVQDLLGHKEAEGHAIGQYIMLAHANAEADELNATIRKVRIERGEIAEGYAVETEIKRGFMTKVKKTIQIAKDDRIMFLENKKSLGVSNGSFGTVESVEFTEAGNVLHFNVKLDGEGEKFVTINPLEYNKFDLGYAATVHKSQAMTQDFVYAFDDKSGWLRNLLYVASSRHQWMFKLFTTQKDFDSVVDSMSRVSLKDSSLGFPWMFAQVRGFATESLNPRFKNQLLNKLLAAKEAVVERFEYHFKPDAYVQRQAERQQKLETEIAQSREEHKDKIQERENARLVARYADSNRAMGKAWEAVRTKMGEFGIEELRYRTEQFNLIAATPEYQELNGISVVRDKLAFEITQNTAKYKTALEVYNLKESKLANQAKIHQKRDLVERYALALKEGQIVHRDRLAEQINQDIKGHFVQIKILNLPTKDLYKQAEAHRNRVFLTGLTVQERQGFRLVKKYTELNREIYGHMKELPASRTDGAFETGLYQTLREAQPLIDKKNALANEIFMKSDICDRSLEYFGIGAKAGYTPGKTHDLDMRWYRLQSQASLHMVAERVHEYREAVQSNDIETRMRLANEICKEASLHHGPIVRGEVPAEDLWRQIRADSKAYEFEMKVADLSLDQQAAYRVVKEYIEARAEVGKAWKEVFETKAQVRAELPEVGFKKVRIYRAEVPENRVIGEWTESFIHAEALAKEKQGKVFYLDVYKNDLDKGFAKTSTGSVERFSAESNRAKTLIMSRQVVPGEFERAEAVKTFDEKAFFAKVTPSVKQLEVKRNALAAKILSNPDHYIDPLLDFKINPEMAKKMMGQQSIHERVELVKRFQEAHTLVERGEIARTLCEDPDSFKREVAAAGVRWGGIWQAVKVADRIALFKEATDIEKKLIRDIDTYKDLNRKVGKAWSQIFAAKEAGAEINPDKQQKADRLVAKRNSYAAAINEQIGHLRVYQSLEGIESHPTVKNYIFKDSKLNFDKLVGHAQIHQTRVEAVKDWNLIWPDLSESFKGIANAKSVGELSRYHEDIFVPALAELKEVSAKIKTSQQAAFALKDLDVTPKEFEAQYASFKGMEKGFKELKARIAETTGTYELSAEDHKRIQKAQRIIRESQPIDGTIGERYLREERGITGPLPVSCRYHPNMYLAGRQVPAVIFVGQVADPKLGPTVVQAIHLDPATGKKVDWVSHIDEKTGKPHKVPAKLTYGRFLPGSSILINEGKDPSKLGIAEGPETGLSIANATPDLRVEIVLGANNLKKVRLTQSVKEVTIFADYDGKGAASEGLVQGAGEFYSHKGVDVQKVIPEGRSGGKEDFNDVARREGIDAVKAYLAKPKLIAKARSIVEVAREITQYAKALSGEQISEQSTKQMKQNNVDSVLKEKAQHHLAAIEKDTAVFNVSQDGKEKYQKARNVYILITKVLRDPILNGYLKEHMPGDYSKMTERLETIKEQKWDRLFKEDAAKAADHYAKDTFKKADEFNKTQDGPERYKIAKAVYTNIRLSYRDPLIKEHLEEHMPTEHAKLQERLSKISEHGLDKRFEDETAKEADKAVKARFNAAKAHLEAENPTAKREELGNLYKVIQKVYNDLLLKIYLQDKTPHEYEKFEQNLQVIKKQGLHVEFEHDMQKKTMFSKDLSL